MELLLAMAPADGAQGGQSMIGTLVMFGLLFAIMYFMMIRPQQKKQKERQKMLDEMKKGDKVITNGGLHATVAGVEEKTLLIDLGNNIKVTVERNAIAQIVEKS